MIDKINNKIQKRGEITTTQLVTIIVLIVSFVIILFLMFRLGLGNVTDQEICHNSVVLKASPLPSGSLNCKTQYICISGGQNCADFLSTEKITIDSKNKNETMKVLADKMAECWATFGEGKSNYGSSVSLTVEYAICSKIRFDKNIQEKTPSITYQEFYTYLEQTKKDEKITYLQYLYGISRVSEFKIDERIKINLAQDRLITGNEYSIITGVDNSKVGIFRSQKDAYIKTHIIPTEEISSRLAEKRAFLTKA